MRPYDMYATAKDALVVIIVLVEFFMSIYQLYHFRILGLTT
jgi:hypothetical protein